LLPCAGVRAAAWGNILEQNQPFHMNTWMKYKLNMYSLFLPRASTVLMTAGQLPVIIFIIRIHSAIVLVIAIVLVVCICCGWLYLLNLLIVFVVCVSCWKCLYCLLSCVYIVCCLIVVPLPPGENPFAVNNNNNNNNINNNK
jgi:hypothetical protein